MRRRIDVYAASRLLGDESRKKGLAASTRRTRYDFVRMAFLAAMKAHVIRQDPPLVSALGHSSPTITLNIYSHLWPKAEDRTRNAAEGLMAAATAQLADSVRTGRA